MHIVIKVGPTKSSILRANTMLLSELAELCSYQKISEQAKRYSSACKNGWDGKVSLIDKYSGSVPSGLVPRIIRWLKDNGHTVELIKSLPMTESSEIFDNINPPETLRSYQRDAIARMVRNKRGILQLPTGAGKTVLAVGIVGELKRNTIFFCHTKELIKQTQAQFEKYYPDLKVGIIGDGVIDPGPITIASIQTISSWLIPPNERKQKSGELTTAFHARLEKYNKKMEEWVTLNEKANKFLKKFPVAIFDECHHLAADTFFTCAQACEGTEYLFALSATPWRDDNADLLIEAGSGSTIYSLSLSDVVGMGFLLPAEIHLHDYEPLPPMNLSNSYAEQYKICITTNDNRNNKIVDVIVNEAKKDSSILVLCREIEHLEVLKSLLDQQNVKSDIIYSKTKNRLELLEKFKNKDIQILLGSTIFDEGVDIPAVDCVVLAGAGRSRVKAYQRIGRALRIYPGKEKAIIHDFKDDMKPFSYHFNARLRLYDSEKCFEVIKHYKGRERKVVNKTIKSTKTLDDFIL